MGSLSVIGLLYRERLAMRIIMQFIVPQFAIGDVVRVEITTGNRTRLLYGSIRHRWSQHYMVVYHRNQRHGQHNDEEEEHFQRQRRSPRTNTLLRTPDKLWPHRWDV